MYTRSYAEEKSGILIPESYGGTAFSDSNFTDRKVGEERHTNLRQEDVTQEENVGSEAVTQEAFNPITKIKMPSFLSNIFNFNNFSLQKNRERGDFDTGCRRISFLLKRRRSRAGNHASTPSVPRLKNK